MITAVIFIILTAALEAGAVNNAATRQLAEEANVLMSLFDRFKLSGQTATAFQTGRRAA